VEYEQVPPAAPIAPWLGGKKVLHRTIITRIEAIEHKTYVEPFVGMGGVFLRRKWRPKAEVANDLNGEITNLFRIGVCQTSCPPISCGVSDFMRAGFTFRVQPDGPCGLPVTHLS